MSIVGKRTVVSLSRIALTILSWTYHWIYVRETWGIRTHAYSNRVQRLF